MSTIKEIADACGVSTASVSNAFTGKGRLSESKRQEILEKAQELSYVPNAFARSLKLQVTRTIGVIAEDLTVFNSPPIVDGIHEYLEKQNYTFILGNLRLYRKYNNEFYRHEEYAQAVRDEFQVMKSKQVGGIIYIGAHKRIIHSLPQKPGIPLVVTYGLADARGIFCVNYDDVDGAYKATIELIRAGHRQIGLITGDKNSNHTADRLEGYKKALKEHAIGYDEDLVIEGDWSVDSGERAAQILIGRGVTGIFCMNDIMAAGVYSYAHSRQLVIGKDLSVIGFDNRDICTVMHPELSTVQLPLEALGSHAAKILLKLIENKRSIPPFEDMNIQCRYIGRQSVAGDGNRNDKFL